MKSVIDDNCRVACFVVPPRLFAGVKISTLCKSWGYFYLWCRTPDLLTVYDLPNSEISNLTHCQTIQFFWILRRKERVSLRLLGKFVGLFLACLLGPCGIFALLAMILLLMQLLLMSLTAFVAWFVCLALFSLCRGKKTRIIVGSLRELPFFVQIASVLAWLGKNLYVKKFLILSFYR